ncbi:hypothetical protein BOW53_15550, partial [Solemya pervernicosa gill symbiont]
MGLMKHYWMELQEQEWQEQKEAWIREELDDPDADESTDGWERLESAFDDMHAIFGSYEDDYFVAGKSRIDIFNETMEASKEIANVPVSDSSRANLSVMLHTHIVTAVEAYLSSTFIETALSAETHMRKLVESDPEFESRKFSRGVAIFAEACFGRPSPSKRQILNATVYAYGAP